jgi:iron uptake system component EfeO
VVSTDDECRVAVTEAASGTLVFEVKNEGSKPTEFYLLAADGVRVVGEVEDIGPGLTRRLAVTVDPGSYLTACKPGMAGEGIRAGFTVTEPGGEQTAPR